MYIRRAGKYSRTQELIYLLLVSKQTLMFQLLASAFGQAVSVCVICWAAEHPCRRFTSASQHTTLVY